MRSIVDAIEAGNTLISKEGVHRFRSVVTDVVSVSQKIEEAVKDMKEGAEKKGEEVKDQAADG